MLENKGSKTIKYLCEIKEHADPISSSIDEKVMTCLIGNILLLPVLLLAHTALWWAASTTNTFSSINWFLC
jgi:hypothetical protein